MLARELLQRLAPSPRYNDIHLGPNFRPVSIPRTSLQGLILLFDIVLNTELIVLLFQPHWMGHGQHPNLKMMMMMNCCPLVKVIYKYNQVITRYDITRYFIHYFSDPGIIYHQNLYLQYTPCISPLVSIMRIFEKCDRVIKTRHCIGCNLCYWYHITAVVIHRCLSGKLCYLQHKCVRDSIVYH